jgi:uncharacterized protein YndB with AHSA1/START domain
MVEDTIERDIVIGAPPERVWAVLTEARFLSEWFGGGETARVDLRPGGLIRFNHGAHGPILARIIVAEEPRRFSWRWSQGAAGEEPDKGNSTLVEFTLSPDAESGGTLLRTVESGFAGLRLPASEIAVRRGANGRNWPGRLEHLRARSEQLPV